MLCGAKTLYKQLKAIHKRMAFFHTYLSLELKRLYNEISIEGHNIIGDESIMSIADETVIKVSKDDFIKKPIKSIKKLLRKYK